VNRGRPVKPVKRASKLPGRQDVSKEYLTVLLSAADGFAFQCYDLGNRDFLDMV